MINKPLTSPLFRRAAEKILSEIKKAKKILLALHVSPDNDSLASVLAMSLILKKMGKKVKIISFSQIPPRMMSFPGIEEVELENFAKVNFADFDLFISLDTAQERMITRSPYPEKFPQNFKIINIDHHATNTKYGHINLVVLVSSTAEILYQLFSFWKIRIDKKLAELLFQGIFGDTGCFQYPLTSPETLRIAADLIEKGASLNQAVLLHFRSYSWPSLKYWGKVLNNMQIDKSGQFVWSKVSREEKEELGIESSEIEGAASLFAPVVFGTEFGIILHEETKRLTRGSLRSRTEFDVSKIAQELGGGGHKQAAGFSLNFPLEEAEKKVLEVARKCLARQ